MEDKKAKLSTEPYKGVRDFYPEDMFVQNYIFDTMKKTAERFGYIEYGASILEPTEIYRSKTSEEIVNEQTYSFKDRGDRDVTLRPEMTPTVARMVAARERELGFPLRWYSIPNVFRYENPQRGRLREHWQLNVDLFGGRTPEAMLQADIEIITLASSLMKAFGAKDSDFEIKINNKGAIRSALSADVSEEDTRKFLSLIDKRNKMGEENFKAEVIKHFGKEIAYRTEPDENSRKIIETLEKTGIKNISFDPYLVRGFDYYTDTVFEVFDTNQENRRSLFGGGRYDNLTENFGSDPVPAVGFGAGDVGMKDFLETHGLLPAYKTPVQIYIGVLDKQYEYANTIALNLRNANVNVFVNYEDKDLRDHFKLIEKRVIPYAIFIGSKETEHQAFSLRDSNLKKDIREFTEEDAEEIAGLVLEKKE